MLRRMRGRWLPQAAEGGESRYTEALWPPAKRQGKSLVGYFAVDNISAFKQQNRFAGLHVDFNQIQIRRLAFVAQNLVVHRHHCTTIRRYSQPRRKAPPLDTEIAAGGQVERQQRLVTTAA